jgi:endoglucanase
MQRVFLRALHETFRVAIDDARERAASRQLRCCFHLTPAAQTPGSGALRARSGVDDCAPTFRAATHDKSARVCPGRSAIRACKSCCDRLDRVTTFFTSRTKRMSLDRARKHGRLWPAVATAVVGSLIAGGCMKQTGKNTDAAGTTPAAVQAESSSKGTKLTTETSIPPVSERTTPVASHGQLSVKGANLVDASLKPVVLRGQSFGWDNWWPQYYNASVVRWLWEDWCVDVVRAAMGIEPEGAYLSNQQVSKQRVEAVIEGAIAAGVYVIIDWHSHNINQPEAVAFFSEMAKKYGDKPNVIYEIFNEPEKDETWPQVKDYATTVIAAIRQHDPDNVIIVGSPEWDQRIDLVAADPLQGQSNIVYSVHFYADTHRDWLRQRTQAAVDRGIPVFVSESGGSEASGQGQNNYTEWKAWIDFMEKNHISWVNWSVSDKVETCAILEPGASASGGWTAAELTDTGEHFRNVLRSYCGK